jgi:hypothetical protein
MRGTAGAWTARVSRSCAKTDIEDAMSVAKAQARAALETKEVVMNCEIPLSPLFTYWWRAK